MWPDIATTKLVVWARKNNNKHRLTATITEWRNGHSLPPDIHWATAYMECHGKPASNNDCPLWFVPGDNGSCECGNDLGGIVKCNSVSREAYLLDWYCMSQDSTRLVVGACPYHNFWQITGREDLKCTSSLQEIFLILKVSCVDIWIERVKCVAGVKMASLLQHSHMTWNVWNAVVDTTTGLSM